MSVILRNMGILRKFIRHLIEAEKKTDDEEELLVEPDVTDGRGEDEVSVAANVAGVTTPLGTGPTYPNRPKKKKKSSKR